MKREAKEIESDLFGHYKYDNNNTNRWQDSQSNNDLDDLDKMKDLYIG